MRKVKNKYHVTARLVLFLVLWITHLLPLFAQGILPFSTQAPGPASSIDLATSNIFLSIPIRTKAGAVPFQYSLVSNSDPSMGIARYEGLVGQFTGPSSMLSISAFPENVQSSPCGDGGTSEAYSNWVIIDGTGAVHPIDPDYTTYNTEALTCPVYPVSFSAPTLDGSGYILSEIGTPLTPDYVGPATYTQTITDRNGNTATPDMPDSMRDVDGNGITMAYVEVVPNSHSTATYTDTLGETALTVQFDQTTPSVTYSYTDANGHTQSYSVYYTSLHMRDGDVACGGTDGGMIPMPTSIIQSSTGQSYNLTYEVSPYYPGQYTGRIEQITLPSGAYVKYTYSGGINDTSCPSASSVSVVPVLTKRVGDGNGHEYKWTYTNNKSGFQPYTVTETDPNGNNTVYTFNEEYQLEKQVYQGDVSPSNLIETTVICYNGVFTNCTTAFGENTVGGVIPGYLPYISQKDVYVYPQGSSLASVEEIRYNAAGAVTEDKKYDYGSATSFPPSSGPSGTPVSDTVIAYENDTVRCGTVTSLRTDLPCTIAVNGITGNGSPGTAMQKNFTYNPTGHPLTMTQLVGGTTVVQTSAQYNPNGTLSQSTDAKGATTYYHYDGTGGCNNLFPTSIVLPLSSLITSQTWDCNGGVLTSTTDVSGSTEIYMYASQSGAADPFWRLLSDRRAVGTPQENWTSYQYPSLTEIDINQDQNTKGDGILHSKTISDGLMRPIVKVDASGAITDIAYDGVGNIASASNPHFYSSSPSDGITTYVYDTLGRQTLRCQPDNGTGSGACVAGNSYQSWTYNGNQVTFQDESRNPWHQTYDAFGRLTRVVEPNNANTYYTYDANGNLICVAQDGGNGEAFASCSNIPTSWVHRSFIYDMLSRLVTASNPETGSVSYGYLVNGLACSGDPSLPCSKTDARGTITNYSYDALNRLTGKTYSNNPTNTASSCYQYDTSSLSPSYATGRLTASWTQIGACASSLPPNILTSRQILSYDAMGHVKSERQCTPGNCTMIATPAPPYSMSYNYDLAGDLIYANDGTEKVSWSIPYDSSGRLSSVSATTTWPTDFYPPQIFSVQGYSPAGAQTNWTMGIPLSGPGQPALTGTRSYDNRLRPTTESVIGHD